MAASEEDAELVSAEEGVEALDAQLALRLSAVEGVALEFVSTSLQIAVSPEERWCMVLIIAYRPDGGAFCAVPRAAAVEAPTAAHVTLDLVYPDSEEDPSVAGFPLTTQAAWAVFPPEVIETAADTDEFSDVEDWGHPNGVPSSDSVLRMMPSGFLERIQACYEEPGSDVEAPGWLTRVMTAVRKAAGVPLAVPAKGAKAKAKGRPRGTSARQPAPGAAAMEPKAPSRRSRSASPAAPKTAAEKLDQMLEIMTGMERRLSSVETTVVRGGGGGGREVPGVARDAQPSVHERARAPHAPQPKGEPRGPGDAYSLGRVASTLPSPGAMFKAISLMRPPPRMADVPGAPPPHGLLALRDRTAEGIPEPAADAEATALAAQEGGSVPMMQIGAGGQAALETLVVQNTALIRLLKRRDTASDPFAEGDEDEESSLLMRGAPGSAQLARFAQAVVQQSDRVVALMLDNARLATGQTGVGEIPDLCYFLERCTAFNQLRGLCYSAFMAAHVANALNRGQFAYGRALANLSVAAHDQVVLDGGASWETGWLITTLPEPPFATCLRSPASGSLLKPHSRLLCASWVTAVVAYLRELTTLEDRRKVKAKAPRPEGPGAGKPKTAAEKAAAKAAAQQRRDQAAANKQGGAGAEAPPAKGK